MSITMLINALSIAASAYGLAFVTWLFYLAAMNLMAHRHDMYPIAKAHAYPLIAVGLVLDVAVNVLVASVLFMKYPQDWLLTSRLKRYLLDKNERPWRRSLAFWVCSRLLDQFDPKGKHCC
jgi:hypothetical protein